MHRVWSDLDEANLGKDQQIPLVAEIEFMYHLKRVFSCIYTYHVPGFRSWNGEVAWR